MLSVKRDTIIELLQQVEVKDVNGHKHLVLDAMEGEGDQAMAFLVKKGLIEFSRDAIKKELDFMVDESLITILQWEAMSTLLKNAKDGPRRVINYMRKKRRIKVKG